MRAIYCKECGQYRGQVSEPEAEIGKMCRYHALAWSEVRQQYECQFCAYNKTLEALCAICDK